MENNKQALEKLLGKTVQVVFEINMDKLMQTKALAEIWGEIDSIDDHGVLFIIDKEKTNHQKLKNLNQIYLPFSSGAMYLAIEKSPTI